MMNLVFFLQTAQNRDSVLYRRLRAVYLLESALQSRIFLDIFAVLVKRRRTDSTKLTTRQSRLQKIRCIHRAFRRASTNKRMKLINKKDNVSLALLDFVYYSLKTLLELAAELRASNKRAQIKRKKPFVFKAFRHITGNNSPRKPLNNRRLTNARLTNQNRVVFRTSRKNLHNTTNLFITPDNRVYLLLPGKSRKVAAILVQRAHRAFRVLIRNPLVSAHLFQSLHYGIPVNSMLFEHFPSTTLAVSHGKENMLHGQILVLKSIHLLFSFGKDFLKLTRKRHLRVSVNNRICIKQICCFFLKFGGLNSYTLHKRRNNTVFLVKKRHKKMLCSNFTVIFLLGQGC